MQIPVTPTIVLAAASLAIIVGRICHVRIPPVWGLAYFITTLLIASPLSIEPFIAAESRQDSASKSAFLNDSLSRSEQWVVIGFGFLTGIALVNSARTKPSALDTYGFLLSAIAGMLFVAQANDFLALGLSLEVLTLGLAPFRQSVTPRSTDLESPDDPANLSRPWGSFDAMVSGWMWLGIALLASTTSTTDFATVRDILMDAYGSTFDQTKIGAPSKLIQLAAGLIVISLLARMRLVPFRFRSWIPAPGVDPGCYSLALLAEQLVGLTTLNRLFGCVFVGLGSFLCTLAITICLTNFLASSILSIRSRSPGVKAVPYWVESLRLLQLAWLLAGQMIVAVELETPGFRFGTFADQTETQALNVFCQISMILSHCGICWALRHLVRADREIGFLEDFKGLFRYAPAASCALAVSTASAIGIPLTAGFWGRWLTMLAGSSAHQRITSSIFTPHPGLRFVMFFGTIATCVVATVVFRLLREMLLEPPLAQPAAVGGRGPLIASLLAAIASLWLGIVPQLALRPLNAIQPAAGSIPERNQRGSGKFPFGQTETANDAMIVQVREGPDQ